MWSGARVGVVHENGARVRSGVREWCTRVVHEYEWCKRVCSSARVVHEITERCTSAEWCTRMVHE